MVTTTGVVSTFPCVTTTDVSGIARTDQVLAGVGVTATAVTGMTVTALAVGCWSEDTGAGALEGVAAADAFTVVLSFISFISCSFLFWLLLHMTCDPLRYFQ